MTHIIIDGDACPVVNSVIELTQETGILLQLYVVLVTSQHKSILNMFELFMSMMDPNLSIIKLYNLLLQKIL